MFLQEKHLLAPIPATTLAHVPAKYNSTEGDWVGVSARVDVMVYNTNKLEASQLPKSIMDLASPEWKGKIGLAPSETDFQPIVTAVIKTYGKARALTWLQGLKANAGSHLYPDNETMVDMVNRGQVSIGVMNHYYWYRERDEVGASHTTSAIAFFAPHDPGYVIDVSGAAVLKSSKHQTERSSSSRSSCRRRARRSSPTARATSTRSAPACLPPRTCRRSPSSNRSR